MLSAVPVFATVSWFTLKVAASTIATGVATASVTLGALYAADLVFEFSPLHSKPAQVVKPAPPLPSEFPRQQPAVPSAKQQPEPVQPEAPVELRPSGELPGLQTITPAQQSERLRAEAALLERARQTLVVDPRAAMVLLNEHEALPGSQLSAERQLMEIDALKRLGRREEARSKGERLLRNAALGLYHERIRAMLAQLPATQLPTAQLPATRTAPAGVPGNVAKRPGPATTKAPPTQSFQLP
jgi:hypothetical protein